MLKPLTVNECRQMLLKLGLKHGVPPRIISERLLSKEDKEDMLNGHISFETLDYYVQIWKKDGMGDYASGSMKKYEHFRAYFPNG